MNHVVIAVPAYSWSVRLATMRSLITDILALVRRGDKITVYDESGSTYLEDARSIIVDEFLHGDGTHLVGIDDDVCWEAGALLRLVDAPVDLVAGIYPKRKDPIEWPVKFLDGELWTNRDGLMEVEGVPTGFIRYSRTCLERMTEAYRDELWCRSPQAPRGGFVGLYDILRLPNGGKLHDDYAFCRRWRDIGGQVWIDPEMTLGHIGPKMFTGSLGDWLRERMKAAA